MVGRVRREARREGAVGGRRLDEGLDFATVAAREADVGAQILVVGLDGVERDDGRGELRLNEGM